MTGIEAWWDKKLLDRLEHPSKSGMFTGRLGRLEGVRDHSKELEEPLYDETIDAD